MVGEFGVIGITSTLFPRVSDRPPNGATPEQPEFQPDSSISSSAQSASVSPTQSIASRTRLGTGGIIRPPNYLLILCGTEFRCHNWEGKMWHEL